MKTKRQNMKNSFSLKELARKALVVLLTISMVSMNSPFAYALEEVGEPKSSSSSVVTDDNGVVGEGSNASEDLVAEGSVTADEPATENDGATQSEGAAGDEATTTDSGDVAGQEVSTTNVDKEPDTEIVDTRTIDAASEVEIGLSLKSAYIHYKGQAVALPTSSLMLPLGEDFEFVATADDGCILDEVKSRVDGVETVLEPNESGVYSIPANKVKAGLVLSVSASNDPFESTASSTPIEEKRNEKQQFEYEDGDVKVVATLTDPAALPADVTFKVTPVTKDTKDAQGKPLYDYDAYMEALNKNAAEGKKYTSENTLLYDVAFLIQKKNADGKVVEGEWTEVQLADGQVHLDFHFKNNQLTKGINAVDSNKVEINHLPLKDSVRSSVETTADANSLNASDIIVELQQDSDADVNAESMQINLDSLSVLGASYGTVSDDAYILNVSGQMDEGTELSKTALVMATWKAPNGETLYAVAGPVMPAEDQTFAFENFYRNWDINNNSQPVKYSGGNVSFELVEFNDPTHPDFWQIGKHYKNGETIATNKGNATITIQASGNSTSIVLGKSGGLASQANDASPAAGSYNITVNGAGNDAYDFETPLYIVLKTTDGKWWIGGPVQAKENKTITVDKVYAEQWQANNALAGNDVEGTAPGSISSIELTTSNNVYSYEALPANARVGSYEVNLDYNAAGATISITQIVYRVSLDLGSENASGLSGSYFALVSVERDGITYYAIAQLSTDGTISQVKELVSTDGEKIAYNPNMDVSVRLVRTNGETPSIQNVLDGKNCLLFDAGYATEGYIVGINSQEDAAQISLSRPSNRVDHTANIQFYEKDKQTVVDKLDAPPLTGSIVALARLTPEGSGPKGATVGWAVKSVDVATANATGKASVQFNADGFTACDVNGNETGALTFDPNRHDINVQIYAVPTNVTTMSEVLAQGDRHIEGYSFVRNENSADEKTSTISIARESDNQLVVNVNFDSPVTIGEESGYYVLAKLEHQSTKDTYCLMPLTANNQRSVSIEMNDWVDAENKEAGDAFTGQEQGLTVRIVKANGSSLSASDAGKGANCTVAEENGIVGPFIAHYGNKVVTTEGTSNRHIHTQNVDLNNAFQPKEYVDYIDVLGNARYFGYVTNEWVLDGDAETNAAVKSITNNGQQSGNDLTGYVEGESEVQPWYIGEVQDGTTMYLKVKGDNAEIYTTQAMIDAQKIRYGTQANDSRIVFVPTSKDEIDAYIDRMIEHAQDMSDALADRNSFMGNAASLQLNGGKLTLDFSNYGPGTYYVSLDMVLGNGKTILDIAGQNGDLIVKKNVDQVIVFNTEATDVKLSKFSIQNGSGPAIGSDSVAGGKSAAYDQCASSIVWNMPNATSFETVGSTTGIFLCPNADATISNTSSGWLIADAITNKEGEWHSIWQRYDHKFEKTSVSISARKRFDGNEPGDRRFTFVLEDSNGVELERVENASTGVINFETRLEFDNPGTYTYRIKELAGADSSIEYDNTIHTATVVVSQNSDNKLVATVTYDNESKFVPVFNNTSTTTTTGELEVTKSVVSDNQSDKERAYKFTVTLSDESISGEHGDMTFENGRAEFTLQDRDSKKATELPIGTEYVVTEETIEGIVATKTGDTGTIGGTVSHCEFVNTQGTGSLKIRKTVSENGGRATTAGAAMLAGTYKFGIFTDKDCTEPYTQNGQAKTVELSIGSDGAWVTSEEVKGLPAGDYWIQEEDPQNGSAPVENPVKVTVVAGKVADEAVIAQFTNNINTGSLKVSKTVVSPVPADNSATYSFTVRLTKDGKPVSGSYGGVSFDANGTGTVEIVGTGEKVIPGLPNGTTYEVSEASVNNMQTTANNATGTITNNNQAVAAFTNTRKTGDLEVSKTVPNADTQSESTKFQFKVELTDTTINTNVEAGKTYGDMNFTNGVATFELSHGQKATATGLPTGIGYTVTETPAAGYTTTPVGGTATGTISDGIAKAEFVNTRAEKGDLVVSKTVASALSADHSKDFSFTVTLKDTAINGTYGGMTFTNGKATFTLKDNESVRATGLPKGVEYTVTEESDDDFVTTPGEAKGSITDRGVATAAFTNTRKTGDLEVSKTVVSDAAADADREFDFKIKLSDATISKTYGDVEFTNGEATVALKGGESKLIEDLPTGVGYTVTESEAEGFQLTGKTGDTGTISATKSEAKFTNTRKTGDLEVSKTVVSDAAADVDQEFEFTVTLSDTTINKTYGDMAFTDGVATFKLKGGQKATATGLPTGIRYEVAETANNDFATTSENATGAITTNKAEAKFTNTRKTGDLEVSKTVVSDAAADADQEFEFTVTLSDEGISGTFGEMEFTDGKATFGLKGGETKSAAGLPTGITYTVNETGNGNFQTESSGNTGTVTAGETGRAKFTNTRKTGDLEVSKTVVSDAAADADQEFIFKIKLSDTTISKTYGDVEFTNGEATVTLKGGESKLIGGLPTGVGYTVTEESAEGFQLTGKTGDTGTISATKSEVKFTNTRKTGDLEVSKTVVSDAAADADQEFIFKINLSDTTISKTYGDVEFTNGEATVTLKGGESKLIGGLPTGVGYTVTEMPYEAFDTQKSGDSGTITKDKATAAFTNKRKTGDLKLSKVLASDAAADADKEFTFTITLGDNTISKTYSDVEFKNGVATVTLKGGESKTIEGLPVGITYAITENDVQGFKNIRKTGESGNITTTLSEASFTNDSDEGGLIVSKTVVSDVAADADQEFEFTVTLSDEGISGTFGEMEFTDGKATFGLKGGETKSAAGLPTGITYTVNETGNGNFQTESSGNTGTIAEDAAKEASFTNTRKTGSLKLSKEIVSRFSTNKDQVFTFTVELSDNTISKTYSGVEFTNGVATVTLKDGESKTIEGLPTGVDYTVTEADTEGFKIKGKTGDEGTISTTMSEAKFTNTHKLGGLTVSKSVVSDAAADASVGFNFRVTLSDHSINGLINDMEFHDGVAEFTLKDGESKSVSDLPVGITYTVTEADAEGFELTAKTGDRGVTSITPSVASFTNTRKTGYLKLSKVLVSDRTADADQEFTFTVTLGDNTINKSYSGVDFVAGVATVTLKGGESKLIGGLPTGVGYTVTEESAEGFQLTGKTGDEGTISTTMSEASFTNARETGDLEVSKTVVSDAAADAVREFDFKIKLSDATISKTYGDVEFTNGEATVTLKGGESKTIEGLPTGVDYTVTESEAEGFQLTGKTGDTGTISATKSEAKFTNTRKTGDLEVSKTVVSDAAADADQEFEFTVTLTGLAASKVNGTYGGMKFTDGVAKVKLKGGEKAQATGLPTGISYTVVETANNDFTSDPESRSLNGTISEQKSVAAFTNTRKTGDLEVSKEVVSDAAADKDQKFEFTVTLSDTTINGTYGQMTFTEGVAKVELKDGGSAVATGLPTGITYEVTEAANNDFVATSENATGAITTNKAEAKFTNTRKQGGLMVHKTLVSDAAADKNQTFEITVTLSDKTISGTYGDMTFENGVAKINVAGGQNKTATGLPTGVNYTVTEAANNDFTTTYEGQTGTLAESNEPAIATVTNTRMTGDLTISKSVVSDRTADSDQAFEFTVNLSDDTISGAYGDMTFDKGASTVSLKGGQSVTASGLPTGITYEVAEATETGFANTKADNATGSITTNGVTAAFENTRETGELTVSKTVESAVPAYDDNQEFTFTVTLDGAPINGEYGDMTFTDGVATVTLKGGQSATARNLPTQVSYTVTEAQDSSAGFDVQKTGDTGVISTQGAIAAFTNIRKVGSLKIQKDVRVDDAATNTKAADGTYTFTVTGPGIYSEGVDKTITITNGATGTLLLENLFEGTYTITEKTDGLPANMKLLSESPQTVTVEANSTATIQTAEFVNNLNSTTAHVEATKVFNNWDGIKWDENDVKGFAFKLVPVDGAPMPANTLIPGEETKVATSSDPVEFSDITFTRAGTYRYKLNEVVPAGAVDGVYKGITYDTAEHDVVIRVDADNDGALHANVLYDNAQTKLNITNTYAATGQTQLKGTKELSGRKFKEGDVWTFTVASNDEQAPMPERTEVTVDASKDANIDFGTIAGFDFEDVGKTFTYTVTETGEVEDVVNDAPKTVAVTVADNGDGTLAVTSSTEETPLVFTNTAQIKVDLVAKKGIEGRDWKKNDRDEVAEEYQFQLYDGDEGSAEKRVQSGVSDVATTRGADHIAKFGTLTFSTDDLKESQAGERYFTYAVQEIIPDDAVPTQIKDSEGNTQTVYMKNGIQYNEYRYDVTYKLFVNGDGELQVETAYKRGDEKLDGLNILNTYRLDEVPVTIKAQKNLSGRAIKDDDNFEFALYYVNKDGKVIEEPEQVKTAVREDDGQYRVTFDPKVFSSEVTENYIIREVVPRGASQNDDGVWVKDGISYDATDHTVRIVTTDEQKNGKLTARVYYDGNEVAYGEQNNTTLPTFTNAYFGAEAHISLDKEYVGPNLNAGAFTFTMTATDESFEPRGGAPVVYDRAFVDGGQALKATFVNGAFEGNTARADAPTITYHRPGTYYYLVSEDAKDGVECDAAKVRVKVEVGGDARARVSYVVDDGMAQTATDRPTLYNNGAVRMRFASAALRASSAEAATTSFEPAVRKVLKNGVLRNGEFSFSLYEGESAAGQPLGTATNDANGRVAFDMIQYGPSDVGRTYTYTIAEDGDGVPDTIKYDEGAIRLSVTVSQKDGAIVAEPTYTKFDADGKAVAGDPDTFVNEYDSIVIRTIKRSREEPHDPLPGAHYGLWMVNPGGEDVYMGLGRDRLEEEGSRLESNDQGELYYDFPMVEGVAYYFLEEFPPPAGHLVDPYPTDYFTLVHDRDTDRFRIVYETDPLFAQKCPDVEIRD